LKKTLTGSLIIVILVFSISVNCFAAQQLNNDNHTDTVDYCLRAHDISVNLSELQMCSDEAEIHQFITETSSPVILIRDRTPIYWWEKLPYDKLSFDFSEFQPEANDAGYLVTISAPAINLETDSQIAFRVYVINDLPEPLLVTIRFAGTELPDMQRDIAVDNILALTDLQIPVKEGFEFQGWYLDEAGTIPFLLIGSEEYAKQELVDDVTIYPVWNAVEGPTEPEKPVEPEEPTVPEKPVEPEKPTEPEKPVEPERPTGPEKPIEPERPTEPEKPIEPEKPTEPEKPVEPEKPTEPEKPVEPEKPIDSEKPAATEKPAEPDTMTELERKTELETPVNLLKWITPEMPTQLDEPIKKKSKTTLTLTIPETVPVESEPYTPDTPAQEKIPQKAEAGDTAYASSNTGTKNQTVGGSAIGLAQVGALVANIAAITLLGLSILSDLKVLKWYRSKKKK